MPLKDIESAEITCLIDNSVDILLPNTKVAFRPPLNENWFVYPLIAEHGFCAAIKLQVNGTEHRLLFDSGLDPLVRGLEETPEAQQGNFDNLTN